MLRTALLSAAALTIAGGCRSLQGSPVAVPPGPEAVVEQEPPRLVVLLVVDQLPAYLMDRFDPAFTGGLRRLVDGGRRFTNATHDHAITETSPGHATISTGTVPAKHGVPSNDWWERINGQVRLILNVVDPAVPLLEGDRFPGASPAVLRRSGLADWMQEADGDSRVVSISGKDRGAVLMAAHSDAHAYWFDPVVGRFVTSVHYRDAYPDWVQDFNDDVLPPLERDSVWALDVPERLRGLARPDTFPFEGDGVHTAFPHAFSDNASTEGERSFWTWFATTPALDAVTLQLALRAVEAEDLGADAVPDLLAVSVSQTDRVGHAYGPRSLEQLDNLMRLDRELKAFFEALDAAVGPDGYVVAFTSDHGVLEFPEVRAAEGRPGVRLTPDSVAPLQTVVDRVSGANSDAEALARGLVEEVPTVSWIDRAWLQSTLEAGLQEPDSFTRLQIAGHVPGRQAGLLARAGIAMQLAEGVLTWSYPVGTGHGSPYLYDRHVPLIFLGPGIEPGASDEPVSIADLAPSLASLLGIATPDDLDGVPRTLR